MDDATPASKHLDAFLDETWIEIDGRRALVFATVVPHDLADAAASLAAIKQKHGVAPTSEVKWSQQTDLSPQVKASIKRDILTALTTHFVCLICLTEGTDKSRAFINALRQVHDFAAADGNEHHIRRSRGLLEPQTPVGVHVSVHHDDDAFQDRAAVFAELASWTNATCCGLERANSAFSAGIQYADILAGTFSYVLRVRFGAKAKVVTEDYAFTGAAEWPLDELFQMELRWSVWGDDPHVTEEDRQRQAQLRRPWPDEWFITKCLGKGIRVHGSFSASEMAVFEHTATYWRGCIH